MSGLYQNYPHSFYNQKEMLENDYYHTQSEHQKNTIKNREKLENFFSKQQLKKIQNTRPGPKQETTAEKNRHRKIVTPQPLFLFKRNTPGIKLSHINIGELDGASFVPRHEVFFINQPEGGFVLKSTDNIVGVLLASIVLYKLQIGSPEFDVVQYKESMYSGLLAKLEFLGREDEAMTLYIKKIMMRPFLLLNSFVPNVGFGDLGSTRAAAILDWNTEDGKSRIRDLGKIIAADIFLYNGDRIPSIYENKGNAANLLVEINPASVKNIYQLNNPDDVSIEFKRIMAIDSQSVSIRSSDKISFTNRLNILKKMDRFLESIFDDIKALKNGTINVENYKFGKVCRITEWVYNVCQYKMDGMATLQLILGIVVGFCNIINMGMERFTRIRYYLEKRPLKDYMDIWANSLKMIDLSFYEEIMQIIERNIKMYCDEVVWVNKVTMGTQIIEEFDDKYELYPIQKLEIDDSYNFDKIIQQEELEKIKQKELEEEQKRILLEQKKQEELRIQQKIQSELDQQEKERKQKEALELAEKILKKNIQEKAQIMEQEQKIQEEMKTQQSKNPVVKTKKKSKWCIIF